MGNIIDFYLFCFRMCCGLLLSLSLYHSFRCSFRMRSFRCSYFVSEKQFFRFFEILAVFRATARLLLLLNVYLVAIFLLVSTNICRNCNSMEQMKQKQILNRFSHWNWIIYKHSPKSHCKRIEIY